MYNVVVWDANKKVWTIVGNCLTNEQAAKLWRRLQNNGMSPRVVKGT